MLTDDERRMITGFFDRMAAVEHPRDPDGEKLIADLMARSPQARYYVTQLAIFQEQALAEAQNRVRDLEFELQQARNPQAAQQQKGGGLFSAFFGGSKGSQRPQPVHAPGYKPGMFQGQQGRPSFLGTAAMTAVGVMGGILLGNALMSALGVDNAAQAATADTGAPAAGPWGAPTEDTGSYADADPAADPVYDGGDLSGGDFGGDL